MPSKPELTQNEKALDFFDQSLSKGDWNRRYDAIARESGLELGGTLSDMENPAFRMGLADALGKASRWPSSQEVERLRKTLSDLASFPPVSQEQRQSPSERARRRAKPISPDEVIAKRVLKRHRSSVVVFLKKAELAGELKELIEVEKRISEGTHQSGKHAAFSARNLMEGVADRLFQPTSEAWRDRNGQEHLLGAKEHKNRLIAYADRQLKGQWEGHEFRAFTGTLDVVMRWTGSGPHGAYKLQEAEHLYTRMLDALATVARAFEVK